MRIIGSPARIFGGEPQRVEFRPQDVGATVLPTPNTVALRDEDGSLSVGTPTDNSHAVRRQDLDTVMSSVLAGLAFQSSWNPVSNTPTLPETPIRTGQYWVVNIAGERFGLQFSPGDWLIVNADLTWGTVSITAALQTELSEHKLKTTTAHGGITPSSRNLIAGDGLIGGGELTANRTFMLGTPDAITSTSTNSTTAESHTHKIDNGAITHVKYQNIESDTILGRITEEIGPPTAIPLTGDSSLRSSMGFGVNTGMLTKADIGLDDVINVEQAPATHVGAKGYLQHGLAGGTNATAGFSQANFTQAEKDKLYNIEENGSMPSNLTLTGTGMNTLGGATRTSGALSITGGNQTTGGRTLVLQGTDDATVTHTLGHVTQSGAITIHSNDTANRTLTLAGNTVVGLGSTFNIPIAAWVASTVRTRYPFQATVTITGATENDIVIAPFFTNSLDVAEEAGVVGDNITANTMRFLAHSIPTAILNGRWYVCRA